MKRSPTLAHAADGDLSEELVQSLRTDAEGVLGACVEDLHHARLAALEAQHPIKAGRNDPCSCGSGKKYKKCCLQTEKP